MSIIDQGTSFCLKGTAASNGDEDQVPLPPRHKGSCEGKLSLSSPLIQRGLVVEIECIKRSGGLKRALWNPKSDLDLLLAPSPGNWKLLA